MRLNSTKLRAAILAVAAALGACETTDERPEVGPFADGDSLEPMPLDEARALAARLAASDERRPSRALAPLRVRLAEHAARPRECLSDAGDGALDRARSLADRGRYGEALALLAPLAGLGESEPATSGAERLELLAAAAAMRASLGDRAGAVEAAERALDGAPLGASGPALALARASAAQASGWLEEAEARYREALDGARDPQGVARTVDPVRIGGLLAANLLAQGRAVEAESVARDGVALAIEQAGSRGWSGPGLPATRLAAALRAQGRALDAEAIARDAIAVFEGGCSAPDTLARAAASRLLVRLLGARGDWLGVGDELRRARSALAEEPRTFGRLHGRDPEPWLAVAESGQGAEALRGLGALVAVAVDARGEEAQAVLELRGARGLVRALAGEREAALEDLRAASAPYLEGRRALGRTEVHGRTGRMWQVLAVYAEILGEGAASAPDAPARAALVDEHFRVSQVLAFGAVNRHFGPQAALAAARDPDLEALVGELRTTGRAIAVLADALERSVVLERRWLPEGLLAARRDRMAALLERRAELDDAIRERFPRYAELLAPRPLGTGQVQRAMRPGEAMVAFQVAAQRSWVWAIPQSGPIEYAALSVDADTLEAWVATLREPLAPAGPVVPPEALAPFDVESAHALFEALLAPVAPGWRTGNHLFVVPDGALRALPMSVLPTAEPRLPQRAGVPFEEYRAVAWLGHQHAISHLPLVTALETIGRPEPLATGGSAYAGFGAPIFAPPREDDEEDDEEGEAEEDPPEASAEPEPGPAPLSLRPALAGAAASIADLPPLPDTEREVSELARVLRSGPETVFLGDRASERNVRRRDLSRRQVVHFASHLLGPGALDGLDVPAIALSHPQATVGDGDGLVDIDEVLALRLDADLVVLSVARSTGVATAALDHAFMHAGARAVLTSAWPVNPEASLALLASLPEIDGDELGRSRSEVLRLAMLRMVAEGVVLDADGQPRYAQAHPLFWAPYALVGDGRRSLR